MAAMPSRELAVYEDNLWFARNTKKGYATVEPAVLVQEIEEGELVAAVKQLLVKNLHSKGKSAWRGKGGNSSRAAPVVEATVARGGPETTCDTAMRSLRRRLTTVMSSSAVPGRETSRPGAGGGSHP